VLFSGAMEIEGYVRAVTVWLGLRDVSKIVVGYSYQTLLMQPVDCVTRVIDHVCELPKVLIAIVLKYAPPFSDTPNLLGFHERHLPYAFGINMFPYLEWLVSISYQLKHEFPDYHTHLYSPTLDTVATVESRILTTLGKLEIAGRVCDRKVLFSNGYTFIHLMAPPLKTYVSLPSTRIWIPPLSARHLPGATGDEEATIQNLQKLCRCILEHENIVGAKTNWEPSITNEEWSIMVNAETIFLSILAKLDYLHHWYLNLSSNTIAPIVKALTSSPQQRYLHPNLLKYLTLFS
jgi:hypothetical protein